MENNTDDLLTFGFQHDYQSIIKVVGVGGGGGNAVNHMFRKGIAGVDFLVCNTDAQALVNSPVPVKVQLGVSLTEGRGAGNKPKRGEQAAIENLAEIRTVLETGTKMLFITAGMGGGTGTGAAPVIAQLAREMDILTIAVVTLPSIKEGRLRYEQAIEGIKRLQRFVDSLLVISNENLHKVYGDLPAREAFAQADNIVAAAVKGCAEIITLHGNINIDFADVNTVLRESGVFIMGTGFAEGENRAMRAAEEALKSPLLDSNDIFGTENILLNITSGDDEVRMGEIGDIIDYLQNAAGDNANIIWGNGYDAKLGNQISVTVIATGFEINPNRILRPEPVRETVVIPVQDKIFQPVNPEPAAAKINETEQAEPSMVFELNPDESFTVLKDEKTREADQKIRSSKLENKQPKPKTADSAEPISNWFTRQFGGLFTEEDDDIGK
ncbi:MAG: cell division protein FtsZ [Mariniphaga sp.]